MSVFYPDNTPYVHPLAVVESKQIGLGTRIWGWTHVQADVVVGEFCNIGEHCFLENGVRVGNHCVIKNGIYLWEGTRVCDRAFLGPHAVFGNEMFPRSGFPKDFEPIRIDEGASVGAGAVIIPGVRIGKYGTVGAGSVVSRDVPEHALVFGNPARWHGWMCCCGLKLQQDGSMAHCACGRRYRLVKDSSGVILNEVHLHGSTYDETHAGKANKGDCA